MLCIEHGLSGRVVHRKVERIWFFLANKNRIEKFEKDHVAQHYFEVLRTLISKKSVFAQQVGLKEVANYLGEISSVLGLKWRLMRLIQRPLSWRIQKFASRCQNLDFL